MLYICKTYDVDIWCKFDKDDGGYYNVRMDNEGTKRKNYSESRKNNRKPNHMKNICSTYEKHMENENENRDINKDVVKDVNECTLSYEGKVYQTELPTMPKLLIKKRQINKNVQFL